MDAERLITGMSDVKRYHATNNTEAGHKCESYNHLLNEEEVLVGCNKNDDNSREYNSEDTSKTSINKVNSCLNTSFNSAYTTSWSVSMIAKPSDDRKASTLLAGWNVSNIIQGTGILGVPYAVEQGGWAAIFLVFFIALLCAHTGKLLIDCMYEKSTRTGIRRRLRVNYPEVGEACFGYRGTSWTDILKMYSNILGVKEWAAINCVVILPMLFITRMSIVSWLSMLSVSSLLSALMILIGFTLTQASLWSTSNIPAFNPQTFPIGFGIIAFSYSAHAVFPSIEGSMKTPNQFNSMMDVCFLLSAIVKACFGTFWVFRFGKDTADVATINLYDRVTLSRISTGLVLINVILAVPLAMFVFSATVDDAFLGHVPHLNRNSNYHWLWLLITRSIAIALALFVAAMVPFFSLVMGVVGSFSGSLLSFVFPGIFHIKLRWKSMKKRELFIDIFIVCFGTIAGITGVVFSMRSLVKAFTDINL